MSPEDIDRLRRRLAGFGDDAAALAAAFYAELFALAPHLRALFDGDIQAQTRKLADMLAVAIGVLDEPDSLVPALTELGRRHVDYGATEEDYDLVGAAFLRALRQCLGGELGQDEEDAWAAFYGEMAETMIAGAQST